MLLPRRITSWCLDLLFPKVCLGCGRDGAFVCLECSRNVAAHAPACPVCSRRNFDGILCVPCAEETGLRRFLSPFSYRDPLIRELIHAYKYEGVRELAGYFAREIATYLETYAVRPAGAAVLVPIPLARSRLRERGFNQAELIACELGARIGLAVVAALERKRATEQQVDMDSFEKRRTNVAGAFAVRDPAVIADRPAILIDDVSTSGSTLSEAARALRAAGAKTVWAIVVAKG